MSGTNPPQGHHFRFYVVLVTLVVAGIFFLLYINDSKGISLTSAMIGIVSQNGSVEDAEDIEEALLERKTARGREVDVVLSFDEIPSVQKKAKVSGIQLRFDDLTTKISVNSDKLELNNLQEVTMQVNDFEGTLDFDANGFSLDGTVRSLSVNNIALSAGKELSISFSDLQYKSLSLDNIEMEVLEFPAGNGQLQVSEKLQYQLEHDDLAFYSFNGALAVDQEAESLVHAEGVSRGIVVRGALMDLQLQ